MKNAELKYFNIFMIFLFVCTCNALKSAHSLFKCSVSDSVLYLSKTSANVVNTDITQPTGVIENDVPFICIAYLSFQNTSFDYFTVTDKSLF